MVPSQIASCATTFSSVEVSGPDVDRATGDRWQQFPAARLRPHRPSKASQPPGFDSWELTTGVFLTSGGDGPAAHLRLLLLLAGDIHPHPGPSWPCPACARSAARGSVLCTACNQWWHLTCAGIRYSSNLAGGWTCQTCQTGQNTTLSSHHSSGSASNTPPTSALPRTLATTPVDPSIPGDVPVNPPSQGGAPNSSIPSLKILQLNVAGLRSWEVELLKFLQDEKIDVACIQETNLSAGARPLDNKSGWRSNPHSSWRRCFPDPRRTPVRGQARRGSSCSRTRR